MKNKRLKSALDYLAYSYKNGYENEEMIELVGAWKEKLVPDSKLIEYAEGLMDKAEAYADALMEQQKEMEAEVKYV